MKDLRIIKEFKKSNFIQFSPNDMYILSAAGNQLIVIDANTLTTLHTFKEIKYLGKISFGFDNENLIAVQSAIKKLGIFSMDTLSLVNIFKITKSDEPQDYNISFTPDNKKIIFAIYNGKNNTLSEINIQTSEIKVLKTFDDAFVNKIEYCKVDNSYLFSIFEREGLLIDGVKYSATHILKWKYPFDLNNPLVIKTGIVQAWMDISYNCINKQYAVYDGDNETLLITDDTLNKEISRHKLTDNRSGYFCNLNWSPDGEFIVMTFLNSIKIIRCQTMECIEDFKISQGFYSEFSNDGKLLLIGTMSSGYLIDFSEIIS